jgi:signal transduction histidine kinase
VAADGERGGARWDALVVAAATLAAWLLSVAFEMHERWVNWASSHEHWQADELAFTLLVLALGLAWFAFQRRREAQAAEHAQRRAQAEAQALLAHNRQLAQALIGAQEGERAAIARELHDELGQACTVLRLETACLRAMDGDAVARAAAAERADAAALALQQGVRGLLHRLRPTSLDTLGLVAALEELCDVWTACSGVVCRLRRPEVWHGNLDAATEIAVYRVAQEALTNAVRHAGARSVQLRLARLDAQTLELEVADDGRGMDAGAPSHGLGLLGARERAAALGGRLHIGRAAGGGVCLTLTLPWREHEQRNALAEAHSP